MAVNILEMIGFSAIVLGLIIGYAIITIKFDIDDKTNIFPFCMIALMALTMTWLNRDLTPTYKLDKVVEDSDVRVIDDKVYVGNLEIEKKNVYSLNFYRIDNYVIDCESYAYICPGVRINSVDKVLVVNKGLADNTLKNIEILNINNSLELHKFVSGLNTSTTEDKNYDKSISGILKNNEITEKDKEKDEDNLDELSEENSIKNDNSQASIGDLSIRLDSVETELEELSGLVKDKEIKEKVGTLEKEIVTLKNSITNLEKEMKEVKNTKHQAKQLVINDASVKTIVVSICVVALLGLFIYSMIIRVNTKSKKELLFTASEAKIREGVMLDKDL